MTKVDEFLVESFLKQNQKELESISSIPECCNRAIELAAEQSNSAVIILAEEYLLSAALTAFFGWCHATKESIEYAIECMEEGIPKMPNYGYKPSIDDFMSQLSFVLGYGNQALTHMPHATWKDLCMHFYVKIYPEKAS